MKRSESLDDAILVAAQNDNFVARFWAKVAKSEGCWNWTGAKLTGYGIVGVPRPWGYGCRNARAHRISWAIEHGRLTTGLCICHRCDNPSCVRPEHLFVGTNEDNIADMVSKRRHGWRGDLAKLTPEQVGEIRRRLPAESAAALAREFQVTQGTVGHIAHGRTWKNVT